MEEEESEKPAMSRQSSILSQLARYVFGGHTNSVSSVAWSGDGRSLASGAYDETVRIWDGQTGELLRTLEGHTDMVNTVAWSGDGRLLASDAADRSIRLWSTHLWETVEVLAIGVSRAWTACAFHPHKPLLITLDEGDIVARLWHIDVPVLQASVPSVSAIHYTTAKIALVGDSGVGKSGLGYRLATGRFQVTDSTHGQQFWVVPQLGMIRDDGTLCEAILWDFAGQPDFRPVHALFLNDVDLALVLFDSSRPDTLTGIDYWLKHLSDEHHTCRVILVAARIDVSRGSLASAELEAFCHERNISGGFLATSAKQNEGIETLLDRIRQHIAWDTKPTTVTTQTFKRMKDYVFALKAQGERSYVLVSAVQLHQALEAAYPGWQFSYQELMVAVGHLQNHGYVTLLRRSSNEEEILLAPDVLINLASSFLLRAQANEKGLGALEEARVLHNEYLFPEVERLSENERDTLLNAVTELFLKRNLCFRESIDRGTFLIFPSLITERPPRMIEDAALVEDRSYVVTGRVQNVYAALVVLLGYSPSFLRTHQWRKQAQYETQDGHICSFKLTNDDPGELELVLYYGKSTPDYIRMRFQGLFEQILLTRSVTVKRYPPLVCPKCGCQQKRRTVIDRIQAGKTFLFCEEDGKKISLPKAAQLLALGRREVTEVARDEVLGRMRTTYETALVRVKRFIRDRGKAAVPMCFISYAWGAPEHERWVLRLAEDLRNADIEVILDQIENAELGNNIARFITRITQSDFVVVIGTPLYTKKYGNYPGVQMTDCCS